MIECTIELWGRKTLITREKTIIKLFSNWPDCVVMELQYINEYINNIRPKMGGYLIQTLNNNGFLFLFYRTHELNEH